MPLVVCCASGVCGVFSVCGAFGVSSICGASGDTNPPGRVSQYSLNKHKEHDPHLDGPEQIANNMRDRYLHECSAARC